MERSQRKIRRHGRQQIINKYGISMKIKTFIYLVFNQHFPFRSVLCSILPLTHSLRAPAKTGQSLLFISNCLFRDNIQKKIACIFGQTVKCNQSCLPFVYLSIIFDHISWWRVVPLSHPYHKYDGYCFLTLHSLTYFLNQLFSLCIHHYISISFQRCYRLFCTQLKCAWVVNFLGIQ